MQFVEGDDDKDVGSDSEEAEDEDEDEDDTAQKINDASLNGLESLSLVREVGSCIGLTC